MKWSFTSTCAVALALSQACVRAAELDVLSVDTGGRPISGVQIQLRACPDAPCLVRTGPDGHAQFKDLKPAHYNVVAAKDGFESAETKDLDLTGDGPASLELTLVPALSRRESIEVKDSVAPLEQGATSSNQLPPQAAKELPGKDFKVSPKYSVRFSVSGYNLTDHFNPEAVHGNIADPAYGLFFGQRGRRFTTDFDVLF
jgi:hypothetical protein